MSKSFKLTLLLFAVALVQSSFFLIPTKAHAAYIPGNIISDSEFRNSGSMNAAQITTFLQEKGSYLANPDADFLTSREYLGSGNILYGNTYPVSNISINNLKPADVIALISQNYGVNPKFLLVLMQREQSLVTTASRNNYALAFAMGYDCPDSTGCNDSNPNYGFVQQVDAAAWQYNHYVTNMELWWPSYLPGNTKVFDGLSVTFANRATAGLFIYTPHLYNGNYNFYYYYLTWFGYTADMSVPVYRFWNNNGTHFYTASESEKANVIAKWPNIYRLEGVAYRVNPSDGRNAVPLYRFYNISNGTHFYTASESEKDNTLRTLGYKYRLDGIAYNVSVDTSGVPVHRFWNNNGTHFYTASESEKNNVITKLGYQYKYEGIAYYIN